MFEDSSINSYWLGNVKEYKDEELLLQSRNTDFATTLSCFNPLETVWGEIFQPCPNFQTFKFGLIVVQSSFELVYISRTLKN